MRWGSPVDCQSGGGGDRSIVQLRTRVCQQDCVERSQDVPHDMHIPIRSDLSVARGIISPPDVATIRG